jgi:predicted lipoprotein with Yx(FWY)xxD motif
MKDKALTTGGHQMTRLLIASAAVVAVLALAACGGGGGDSSDSSAAPPASNGTATVSVEEIGDAGPVLVDSAGKALYTSDEEAADSSVVCTEGCASFWEPLTIDSGAPTGDSLPGELGVFERPDGTRQVTLVGKRLYTFVEDEPGEVTGDGFSDAFDGQQFTWHVVSVGGAPDSGDGGSTDDGPFGY